MVSILIVLHYKYNNLHCNIRLHIIAITIMLVMWYVFSPNRLQGLLIVPSVSCSLWSIGAQRLS